MRVALSEGRLSKWEQLRDELQPHQLRVLQAYARIEPWGEERADMRSAFHTSIIASTLSMNGDHIDPEVLRTYLGNGTQGATQSAAVVSPNAAAASMAQMYPGLCK